jgi:hypothetical protein
LIVLAAAAALYIGANALLWGEHGMFNKASNVGKNYLVTLDMAAAAQEAYGAELPADADDPGLVGKIGVLIERWPRNLMYAAERMPGVLLSPILLFALILPFLARRRGGPSGVDELPLLLFTLWPLIFYPLLGLEPRLLFPTLIGVCIFGAAGLLVFGRLAADQLSERPRLAAKVTPALAITVLVLLVPVGAVLAWQLDIKRGFHREVGAWLSTHLPADIAIAGDGYGFVGASTFWAGIAGEPRLWVDDPAQLAPWARAQGFPVLLLFEPFLREANPELLTVLDTGVPGMRRLHRFEFDHVGRVDVLALPEQAF